MEAPQKRARDEEAATERPNKKYKCEPSLDTAAKQEDLSALSKPELRALVASARALARRADGEIAARHIRVVPAVPPAAVRDVMAATRRPALRPESLEGLARRVRGAVPDRLSGRTGSWTALVRGGSLSLATRARYAGPGASRAIFLGRSSTVLPRSRTAKRPLCTSAAARSASGPAARRRGGYLWRNRRTVAELTSTRSALRSWTPLILGRSSQHTNGTRTGNRIPWTPSGARNAGGFPVQT